MSAPNPILMLENRQQLDEVAFALEHRIEQLEKRLAGNSTPEFAKMTRQRLEAAKAAYRIVMEVM